ncbi:hypothetical protein MMC24_006802 [Lignoscripta atroalba]|nr:hypothetical protein [Lignoscripta atroalba]
MFSPDRSRWLRLQLKASRKFYKELSSPKVLRLSPHQIVKLDCPLSELKAMQYVREKTTVPIPKILKVFPITGNPDRVDIILKFVPGETLARAWHHLSPEQKRHITTELASYINQLRGLHPPKGGMVANTMHGPAYDHRLGSRPFGPFECIADFHTFVRQGAPHNGCGDEKVTLVHGRSGVFATKYSHADLSPENIIVKDGRIEAIIDWEFAGWWPEYWEYTKIRYGYLEYRADFYEKIDMLIQTYPDELAAEMALWKRWDSSSYDRDLYK